MLKYVKLIEVMISVDLLLNLFILKTWNVLKMITISWDVPEK
jgi:hypothetical protein